MRDDIDDLFFNGRMFGNLGQTFTEPGGTWSGTTLKTLGQVPPRPAYNPNGNVPAFAAILGSQLGVWPTRETTVPTMRLPSTAAGEPGAPWPTPMNRAMSDDRYDGEPGQAMARHRSEDIGDGLKRRAETTDPYFRGLQDARRDGSLFDAIPRGITAPLLGRLPDVVPAVWAGTKGAYDGPGFSRAFEDDLRHSDGLRDGYAERYPSSTAMANEVGGWLKGRFRSKLSRTP